MKVMSHMNQSLFSVIIPETGDLSSLPKDILKKLGSVYKIKNLDLQPGDNRLALSSDEAIADIQRQGYHTVQATITSTIRES